MEIMPTLQDKILLHLLEFQSLSERSDLYSKPFDLPFEISQPGIAEGAGVDDGYVHKVLGKLKTKKICNRTKRICKR